MRSHGIYTLDNDVVYDQLVALLNSIEVNVSPEIPVCIIPFDERLERVKQEVDSRPNVTLFDNGDAIQRCEDFAQQVWLAHPDAKRKVSTRKASGISHQRKLAAFEGSFEKFIFYDADSLAMKRLDDAFEKLETYDFVFDAWEHRKSEEVAALNIPLIKQTGLYEEEQIRANIHCSSFFGSKKGIFDQQELSFLKQLLVEKEEAAWISRWWNDAFLFSYLTLRSNRSVFNYTLSSDGKDRTGNCADSDPFVNIDNVLYNEQGLKPIHRLHYMNYSASNFARLSQGEDVDIRYKDIFLHYRFLKNPEQKPKQLKPPSFSEIVQKKFKILSEKLK